MLSIKFFKTSRYWGIGIKKASCPWFASISEYDTFFLALTSDLTISRDFVDENLQSLVKDMTKNLESVFSNAFERSPSNSSAGSKIS